MQGLMSVVECTCADGDDYTWQFFMPSHCSSRLCG